MQAWMVEGGLWRRECGWKGGRVDWGLWIGSGVKWEECGEGEEWRTEERGGGNVDGRMRWLLVEE